MSARDFQLKQGTAFSACPECGNHVQFRAVAERCAEDLCEVWVVCAQCGHDPTRDKVGARLEDVWGDLDLPTIYVALQCREEALAELVTVNKEANRG